MREHLDEGTIHAWLDGALDATQSADVDTHVQGCAECSAKVAEARGLIAASSRILTALDDVPANVIPKPAAAPIRRRRSIAPWVSGLAAAAILVTLWRTGEVQQPPPLPHVVLPEIRTTSAPEPPLGPLVQPAPPPAATVASKSVQNQAATVGSAAGAPAAGAAAADLAAAQVTPPPAPSAPAPAPLRAAAEESQRREAFADEAGRRARSDTVTLEGCYPYLEAVTVTSATVESRAPERMRRASGAAAPAAQKSTADAVMPAAAALRLDTANVVRSVVSNRLIGSWQPAGADSVRVTLGGNTVTLAKSSKVRCP